MTSRKPKVLLLHVPNFNEPENDATKINVMPSGFISISNFLTLNSVDNEVLHLGIEKRLNPAFDLPAYIHANGIEFVLSTLFWHHQARSVFETLDELKGKFPHLKTILGGLSATLFVDEIIRDKRCVDFVIRGNGELPVLLLLQELQREGQPRLDRIPNLTWRAEGQIVDNPIGFECSGTVEVDQALAGDAKIDFNHASLSNVRNWQEYLPTYANYLPFFPLALEYGSCQKNCYSCPLSAFSMTSTFPTKKKRFVFGPEKIARDIRILQEQGINRINSTITFHHAGAIDAMRAALEYDKSIEFNVLLETCAPFSREALVDLKKLTKSAQITAYVVGDKNFTQRKRGPSWVSQYLKNLEETMNFARAENIEYYAVLLGDPILTHPDYEAMLEFVRRNPELHPNIEIYPFTPDPKTEHAQKENWFNSLEAICRPFRDQDHPFYNYMPEQDHEIVKTIIRELEDHGAKHPSIRTAEDASSLGVIS